MELAPFKPQTLPWLRVFAVLTCLGWVDLLTENAVKPLLATLIGDRSAALKLVLAISFVCGTGSLCLMIAAILHVIRRKLAYTKTFLLIVVLALGGTVTPAFYFWFIWRPKAALSA